MKQMIEATVHCDHGSARENTRKVAVGKPTDVVVLNELSNMPEVLQNGEDILCSGCCRARTKILSPHHRLSLGGVVCP